jgi:LPS-assembly lipoprotein
MSLPDQSRKFPVSFSRGMAVLGVVAAMAIVSACTVRPLYSNAPMAPGASVSTTTALRSIAIKPVETRYGQEVRNHLIFGFNGGAGQPASPVYSLNLGVTAVKTAAAIVQRVTEDEPTAGTMTVASSYVLTEIKTGKVVARGKRSVSSSYDIPRQGYAALRAEKNAQDRAARELAELLQLSIAQDLSKL